jgi:hypothetical protein
MPSSPDAARDDRVLPETRKLSVLIFPFLIVAFCVLYPVPSDTGRLFAWRIQPTMTPMVLASAYLGGGYFFLRAWRASAWHTIKVGFVPVTLFASALGISTIVHWDKFNHDHVAFWLWAGLYFTTPFVVFAVLLRNQRYDRRSTPDELALSQLVRVVVGATGVSALFLGAFLFVVPTRARDIWPWALTLLTARVMGSVLMLGVAGIGIYLDPRWSTARLMLQVERFMIALILIASVRAHDQFDTSRPLTWLLGIGLVVLLVASTFLDRTMERRAHA